MEKYVLICQDYLNDVKEIYILDTKDEAVAKMEHEFNQTLAWLKIYRGVGDDDFIMEKGNGYRNLISKSRPEDLTYLWSIHISD